MLVKGTYNKIPAPRVLWAIAHAPNDNVTFTGSNDGRVLVWRAPGDCFAAQKLHKPDCMVQTEALQTVALDVVLARAHFTQTCLCLVCVQVYALAFSADGKVMWTGAGDQTACMWSMKDYQFTKLRSYDFSFEGAGALTSLPTAPSPGDDSRPSSKVVRATPPGAFL